MSKEAWYKDLIAQQQESGLSIKEFCSNQNVASATFHYWKKKFAKRSNNNDFIPMVVKPENSVETSSFNFKSGSSRPSEVQEALFELVYPNGTVLRIKSGLDLSQLQTLIHLYD